MKSHSSIASLPRAVACGLLSLTLGFAACAGPDTGDDRDPTPTSEPTATVAPATATSEPTATTTTASASPDASPTRDASPEGSPTNAASPTADDGTPAPEGTATGTTTAPADASPDGTTEPNATRTGSPTASGTTTPASTSLTDRLPTVQQFPDAQYIVATTGSRTAQELANAYAEPVAHLRRLDEWGFVQHVYREFAAQAGAPEHLPTLILTTINVYGSPEQADEALNWLNTFQTSIGAAPAAAPQRGDAAVALTVNTAGGVPTASIYVRVEDMVYAFYAEGGDALAFASGIVERVIPVAD